MAVASAMSLSFGACTTYPDGMHLDMRGIERVPSRRYIPARARDELALAILFEERAPFATVDAEGLLAQFHGELRDAANKAVSIRDRGLAFFDGAATEVDPSSGLMLLSDPDGHKERLKYRAVAFFGGSREPRSTGQLTLISSGRATSTFPAGSRERT